MKLRRGDFVLYKDEESDERYGVYLSKRVVFGDGVYLSKRVVFGVGDSHWFIWGNTLDEAIDRYENHGKNDECSYRDTRKASCSLNDVTCINYTKSPLWKLMNS
jgi:hypothetical protein